MTRPRAPRARVEPCLDELVGRNAIDWCRTCGHVLAVHRFDRVCSLCDAIEELRAELRPPS